MPKRMLDVLEHLLATSTAARSEVQIRPRDEEDLQTLCVAPILEFDAIVAAIATSWGPPAFRGVAGVEGYPAWADYLLVAYWQRKTRLAFVGIHIGGDVPVEILLGVSDGSPL